MADIPRPRTYCCLKKVGKCKKRLEGKDPKPNISQVQDLFKAFVGDEDFHLFDEDDVLCTKHLLQVKKSTPGLMIRKRPIPMPIITVPSKVLRSGKLLHGPISLPRVEHDDVPDEQGPPTQDAPEFEPEETSDTSFWEDEPGAGPSHGIRMDTSRSVPNSSQSTLPTMESQLSESQQSESQHSVPSFSQDSAMQITVSQRSCISAIGSSTSNSTTSSFIHFRYIQSTKFTQSKCFICDSTEGRKSVPWAAIRQTWFKLNIHIKKENRVCPEHLDRNKLFTEEALGRIEATKQGIYVKSIDFGLWLHEVSDFKKKPPFSFDHDGVAPEKYKIWTPLNKEDFDDLANYLTGHMRDSSRRTVRNGLAMFLILLRTNLKQDGIADMFATTQQNVSSTIDTVSTILLKYFVPNFLGYHHITRDDALERHSSSLTSRALHQPPERLAVIVDCTYTYIEKPGNPDMQRKTYSLHKHRNLLKPMLLVFPDGYILEAAGPYFTDSKNNDAEILKHHYENSDLLLFLEEDDFILWDRGYRDAVDITTQNKISSFMPSLLPKNRQQFTCEEANDSRKVTLTRWVVEAVNGELKNVFPFFKHTIEATYIPKIMGFVRIACAILNRYFPRINPPQKFHGLVADAVEAHTTIVNELKSEVEELGFRRLTASWRKAAADLVLDFPKLQWDELKMMTLGSYQLKIADRYNQEHLKSNADYGIMLHRDSNNIIRGQIQSRFQKSKIHSCWVKYSPGEDGLKGIKGLYCTCKVGERTLGCCSHLTAVVKYLSFDRHQTTPKITRQRRPHGVIDCAATEQEEEEGDAEEDDDVFHMFSDD